LIVRDIDPTPIGWIAVARGQRLAEVAHLIVSRLTNGS
jgi:hypothetical protein